MIPVERIDQNEAPVPQMPRNIEAEAALLGALLIDNRMADALDERLAPDHFYEPGHGRVFSLIKDMRATEKLANPVTLRPLVEQDRDIARLGGAQYLAGLTSAGGAGLIGARQFALQIYELAVLRSLADVGRALVDSALDTAEEVNASAKIEHAEQLLAGIASNNDGGGRAISFRDAIAGAVRKSEAIGAGKVPLGVQVKGLPEWNDIVTGMQPGEVILLGGRPSMGKTALSLMLARGAAAGGHGTLFISREMKVEPIAMRMLADLLFEAGSQATFDDVRRGTLSRSDFALAAEIEERIASWPLEFEEPDRLNAARIAPIIRQHKRRMERRGQTLELVVIDYVGLVPNARPLSLSPDRRRGLAARLAEIGGAAAWDEVLARIRGSPFLRGETSRNGFVAEIDWLLKPINLRKVMEGNYDERPSATPRRQSASIGAVDAMREARNNLGLG